MAKGALNFKMDETDINKVKEAAVVYNTTMTEIITEAVHEYLEKIQKDPFYRLSVNVMEASAEESADILGEIEGLSDDDLMISSVKKFEL
jgi:hypothetical protein